MFFRHMKERQTLEAYLGYSKKDRIGILAIIFFVLAIYLLPRLFAENKDISIKKDDSLLTAIDTLKIKQALQPKEEQTHNRPRHTFSYPSPNPSSSISIAEVSAD